MTRISAQVAASAIGIAFVTWLLRQFHADAIEGMLAYLVVVIAIATYTNRTITLASSLAAAVAFDFFLLPPFGTFAIESVDGVIALLALLVGGAIGAQVGVVRRERAAERALFVQRLIENEASLERRIHERTEALSVAEERLRLAARATSDALRDWDVAAGTLWWSEAFGSLFGHPVPPRTVPEWIALIHPDDADRVGSGLRQFLDGRDDVWRAEYRLRRRNGSYGWVLDRGYTVRGADGGARRMIGAMMDITERKESERMKSDFVSFVSHQLRTPLAGMNWMLELAADSDGLPATTREYIAEARESAARLVTLVNDLLDIARLESGRAVTTPEPVDLNELVASVLREMQALVADKRHQVTVQSQGNAIAWADPQLVRQVVANLLSNAVKYTPPDGRITVSLGRSNGAVECAIADTGVGIPGPAQARLFERFFRADNALALEVEGTGLGLHLVRLIVEQAGGRVWCESREGHGSVFSFSLPAAREGAQQP